MKVEELRIGNLFKGNFGDDVYEVGYMTPGTEMCVWIKGKNSFVKEADLEGIPLTEEWLVKFGFEKPECLEEIDRDFTKQVGFRYVDDLGNKEYAYVISSEVDDYSCYYYVTKEIKFVHQLQNLYYALTGGEELEVK